ARCRRYKAGKRAAPALSKRASFPARGHDARSIRAGTHPRSAAPRRWQQEPGGAPARPHAQRAAIPPDSDGARGVIASYLADLESRGLWLVSDPRLPSLATVVAGEPVRGSWWAHPESQRI